MANRKQPEPTVRRMGKAVGAGLGGALATIAVWLVESFSTVLVPPEVAAAFATLFSVIPAYLVKD